MNQPATQDPADRTRLAARLAGAAAGAGGRVAGAAGLDRAADHALEEAVVRALESPAVGRALIRVLESEQADQALERALASRELEAALIRVIDSALVDRLADHLMQSDLSQRLVERVAEAPEIRAAIASQGIGFLGDLGRHLRAITAGLDRGLRHLARRLFGRRRLPPAEVEAAPEAGPGGTLVASGAEPVGLVTRAVATLIDAVLLNGVFFFTTTLLGATLSAVFSFEDPSGVVIALGAGAWAVAGVFYLFTFWALAGQTPGMRFLAIRIERDGDPVLGWRCALTRLVWAGLSVLALGIPFLRAVLSDDGRALHDRMAATTVLAFDPVTPGARRLG